MNGDKKTILKNFHTIVFCLKFLVILFDSHIFLLKHVDQSNFFMYIIMPKIILAQSLEAYVVSYI